MEISTLVQQFQADYLDHPRRKFRTYDKEFGCMFRKLPQDQPITIELLTETILSVPEESRQRKRAVRAFQNLATFAGLEADFSKLSGTYSPSKTKPRILPSDPEIVSFYNSLSNHKWRWVYGAISTYGLRPHEAFFLRINSDGTANVLDGKTGPRKVWPFLPEWYYEFELSHRKLPNTLVEGRTFEQIGHSVLYYLRRTAKCPFRIYNLRHAWAVRVMDLGLRDHLAAKQMGHSIEVHQRIYQHWISDREHQAAFDEIMQSRSPRR